MWEQNYMRQRIASKLFTLSSGKWSFMETDL